MSEQRPLPVTHDVPFLNVVDPAFDFNSPEVAEAQRGAGTRKAQPASSSAVHGGTGTAAGPAAKPQWQGLPGDERYLDGPIYDWFVPMIVNHTTETTTVACAGPVNKAFTPRMINNLRPFIRAAGRTPGRHLGRSRYASSRGLRYPLPLAVMCELLGVAGRGLRHVHLWTTDIVLSQSRPWRRYRYARSRPRLLGCTGSHRLMNDKQTTPG